MLVLSALMMAKLCQAQTPAAPCMDDVYTVESLETQVFGKIPYSENTAVWYYNWPTRQMRYDHGKGQQDYFCNCANPDLAGKACQLLFTNITAGGWMYVLFPQDNFCCRLCNAEDGCSVLRPDWICDNSETYYVGSGYIEGNYCMTWAVPGTDAVADMWSVLADPQTNIPSQTPCRYFEYFNFGGANFTHQYLFDVKSYSTAPIPDSVFQVPPGFDCSQTCPNMYPNCMAAKRQEKVEELLRSGTGLRDSVLN